jgi:ERCC4-type nuclease
VRLERGKELKEGRVRIYVDVREERSNIPRLLEEEGILVVRKRLDVGDYLVSEDSVVERKSVNDLASKDLHQFSNFTATTVRR